MHKFKNLKGKLAWRPLNLIRKKYVYDRLEDYLQMAPVYDFSSPQRNISEIENFLIVKEQVVVQQFGET